ncbi:cytochrome c [Pseudomonas sp. R-28-1W-6]|jgi:cytochrome c556|uniref:c-type cytochrome n=1 Tax=Pseudomonas sp. R-28-1W-6 TaxID=2650101 RepID=UPI0013661282|nr:cytochrome c [Pseudomonas sp. R-28-1W-6]MWV10665.1 cytochrome c [Pseudomonas sp. R-28-1W-6]
MKAKSLLLLCLCALLSACGGVDPNSPQGQRQTLFKQMLKTSEDLGGMLRGRLPFNEQRFAQGAQQLDELSRKPWQHFPQIAESERSSAKPEVWQEQARFQQLARDLEAATATLRTASTEKPLAAAAMAPLVQRVEDSCEACHKAFRAY